MEDDWFGIDYQAGYSVWTRLFEGWNNTKTLSRIEHYRRGRQRLLEIGVGSGSFLNEARQRGYEVSGCDLSPSICKNVFDVYGINVFEGDISKLEYWDKFDVIVVNHVVEHTNDPVQFLSDIKKCLVPNGIIHIAVPNIECWEAAISGWTSYEPYHLSYFSQSTLKKLVVDGGWSIEKIFTRETFSGWFLAIFRTMSGMHLQRDPGSAAVKLAAVNRKRSTFIAGLYYLAMIFSGVVLFPIRIIQGFLGCGDELVCIALNSSGRNVK